MWKETETTYGFNVVENENGTTLGYSPLSGVKLIEKDGLAFKDLARTGELLPYEDWRLSAEERAADLAHRLTPEQIAGLMCYSVHQIDLTKDINEEQKNFMNHYVRSVLNSAGLGSGVTDETQIAWSNSMQKYAESMPLGIPCYIASDPRNGQGVSDWPGNLSLAATFDPELAKESAKCQSIELRDLGVACFLAPQVDVATDPRWFRFSGTFGEDPALSRDMTRSFCDGLQSTYDENGEDQGWGRDSVTAMVKHWTGEASCEGGREAHLEGGKYAVYPNHNFEALMVPFVDGAFHLEGKTKRAAAVMSSYSAAWSDDGSLGDVVGSSYSKYKIHDILRERYGFDGVVCTDWMVLNEGKAEGARACGWGDVIEDINVEPGEKALMAIMVGVDQMGGCSNPPVLVRAYEIGCEKYGKEFMDDLFAQSAERLLKGYFLTGMFDNPYIDEAKANADINSADKQAAALAAQVKAVVLLKNKDNAIRPRQERMKVYVPALYEAPHKQFDHHHGLSMAEETVSYPISLEVCEKYFDVLTDTVEGNKIIATPSDEELKSCDLFLITAKEPGNIFQQEGRDTEAGDVFHPLTRQYKPYTADGQHVRKVSIAGNTLPDGTRENRSYYGQTSYTANPEQLDQILDHAAKAKELGVPSVACVFTGKPMCFHEFEPSVDGLVVTFSAPSLYGGGTTSSEALARIVAGVDEPSGLLPMQMPRDMDDVERQSEDLPRDMECYTDAAGHKYDFAYGMNYSGVIKDARVEKYSKAPLTGPEDMGK